MESDSDRTIDSDELEEIIKQAQKESEKSFKTCNTSTTKSRKHSFHDLSDSEDEISRKKVLVQSKKKEISSLNKSESPKQMLKEVKNVGSESKDNSSDSDSDYEVQRKKKKEKPVKANKSMGTKNTSHLKCQFGKNCYRKNPAHFKEFLHDDSEPNSVIGTSNHISHKQESSTIECHNYQFYLTKVNGIPQKFNKMSLDIKDILSLKDGTLISSAQFNYMFDIKWLVEQYPEKYRRCPITVIHGEQRDSKTRLERSGADYPNIKFCQAKLDIPFGTHHTKMMFLLYKEGFRIVIHTSNICDSDWFQKTQGMWMSHMLPKLKTASITEGESPTYFKADILEYLSAYGAPGLDEWLQVIKSHDFCNVRVFLVGSVPGRHLGSKKTSFGHLKLRKLLNLHGSSKEVVNADWAVVCQFSSIGSLGASPDQWLTGEFASSLATTKNSPVTSKSPVKLVFPSVDNVRKSLEGYPAGGSLPYSIKVAQKQPYLKSFMHQWKSDTLGRSEASPHIKTFLRLSPDNSSIAWFCLTSANLSKAAWGTLEKKGAQFMIRSYELGILFLPKFFDIDMFSSPASSKRDYNPIFPVPYDIPLLPYSNNDQPWIWDIPHMKAPDRFGQMWCPPL